MALFGSKKQSILKAAIKQTKKARANEGAKADQLFLSAYGGFADVLKDDLVKGEALYNWGFALLHQAKTKAEDESVKLYLDAISKFSFCLLVTPNHLGAAIDGGVAYMDLARILKSDAEDELYDLAMEFFENADRIQKGSSAYNLACIFGLRGQQQECQDALQLAYDSGSLPGLEEIQNDDDLALVNQSDWFTEFVDMVSAGPQPEEEDENVVKYDVEGNVKKKKKKKVLEFESDGVVYDVEGNVIRKLDADDEQPQDQDQPETEEPKAKTESEDGEKTSNPNASDQEKD